MVNDPKNSFDRFMTVLRSKNISTILGDEKKSL